MPTFIECKTSGYFHNPEKTSNNENRVKISSSGVSSTNPISETAGGVTVNEIKYTLNTVMEEYQSNNKNTKNRMRVTIGRTKPRIKNLKKLVNKETITRNKLIEGVNEILHKINKKKHDDFLAAFRTIKEKPDYLLSDRLQLSSEGERYKFIIRDELIKKTENVNPFDGDDDFSSDDKVSAPVQSGMNSEGLDKSNPFRVDIENEDEGFDVDANEFDKLNPFNNITETASDANLLDHHIKPESKHVHPPKKIAKIISRNKEALTEIQLRASVEMKPDLLTDFDKIKSGYNNLLEDYKKNSKDKKLQSLPVEITTPQGFANYINQQLAKVKSGKNSNLVKCLSNAMQEGRVFSQLFELENINNKYYFNQKSSNTNLLNKNEENKVNDFLRLYQDVVVKEYKGKKNVGINYEISSVSCLLSAINEKLLLINNEKESHFLSLMKKMMDNNYFIPEYKIRTGFPVQLVSKNNEKNKLNHTGEKFKEYLQEYLNTGDKQKHHTILAAFFKNTNIQSITFGRIENGVDGKIIIDSFPDDNSEIANLLNTLLKGHESKGSLYLQVKNFFASNKLAVGLRWIPSDLRNKGIIENSVELIKKSPQEVKLDIKNMDDVSEFIGRYVATIKIDREKLTTVDKSSQDIRVLQTHFFNQKEIFINEVALPKYGNKGILGAIDHGLKNAGQLIKGRPNVDVFFGKPEKEISKTLASIINKFDENLRNKPNKDHIVKSAEYKNVIQRLNNLHELVNQYEKLINTKAIEEKNNIVLPLRYALAAELVKIKQSAKTVNVTKRFFIFTGVNVVATAVIGTAIATVVATGPFSIPLIIAAACIFLFIQYVIFKQIKPQIQRTELSNLVRDSIKENVVQHGSRLSSHDITWKKAIIDHWKTPVISNILRLFVSKSTLEEIAE